MNVFIVFSYYDRFLEFHSVKIYKDRHVSSGHFTHLQEIITKQHLQEITTKQFEDG